MDRFAWRLRCAALLVGDGWKCWRIWPATARFLQLAEFGGEEGTLEPKEAVELAAWLAESGAF